ncbi:type II toxin-antitoxin system HipA family toxin [Candidatus Palauibacter sp.]|uniref:type II toxin-antitoxin system HipA family toxin n=1 Tax=Candidatus Palauibacter sp. TaxID=3101350 RepID=UPI003D0CB976
MNGYTTVRVRLWGREVGLLLESDRGGRITFEYDPGFADFGLEISPIHLPLARSGPVSFPELARRPVFLGLPGVFADALPDRFGNAVIRRYFEARGRPEDALSPLQRLLYMGDRAMGALEFQPAHEPGPGSEEALEVRSLVEEARRVIEGDVSVAVPEMMQVGGSAGGARPKALILWDRETGRVRSGFACPEAGEELWLIKFDGVSRDASGLGMRANRHPGPWGRIEFAYSCLARDAGIEIAETHLFRDGDLAHFMTRRFDRVPARPPRGDRTGLAAGYEAFRRLHLHSLGGLQHIDFNDQFVFSYEGWFDTIRALGLGQESVNEAFRRMVLNVATVNFDDHVKNFAFLMDRAGRWRLAPAYDLTYAENDGWTRQHQMSVNGRFRDVRRADLLRIGRTFDVPAAGRRIIDEVMEALDGWPAHAYAAGVPADMAAFLDDRFEREIGLTRS